LNIIHHHRCSGALASGSLSALFLLSHGAYTRTETQVAFGGVQDVFAVEFYLDMAAFEGRLGYLG